MPRFFLITGSWSTSILAACDRSAIGYDCLFAPHFDHTLTESETGMRWNTGRAGA